MEKEEEKRKRGTVLPLTAKPSKCKAFVLQIASSVQQIFCIDTPQGFTGILRLWPIAPAPLQGPELLQGCMEEAGDASAPCNRIQVTLGLQACAKVHHGGPN